MVLVLQVGEKRSGHPRKRPTFVSWTLSLWRTEEGDAVPLYVWGMGKNGTAGPIISGDG